MADISSTVEQPVDDDARRMNRRSLIKGAAIAGAAAWTAPVIIDSLSSPAAAASKPGCYTHIWYFSTSKCADTDDSGCRYDFTNGCNPSSTWNQAGDPAVSVSGCSISGGTISPGTATVSSSACKIVAYGAAMGGTTCADSYSLTVNTTSPTSSQNLGSYTTTGWAYCRAFVRVQCT